MRAHSPCIELNINDLCRYFHFVTKIFKPSIFPGPILTLLLQKQAHPSTANRGTWTRKPCPPCNFYRENFPHVHPPENLPDLLTGKNAYQSSHWSSSATFFRPVQRVN